MNPQSNIEKIKQVLKEINDARERASQGEWYPCGCRFSMLSNDLNEQEVLDIADFGVQYHPPKSEYVNNHKYCLHLWRPISGDIIYPHKSLVGV